MTNSKGKRVTPRIMVFRDANIMSDMASNSNTPSRDSTLASSQRNNSRSKARIPKTSTRKARMPMASLSQANTVPPIRAHKLRATVASWVL